MPDAPRSSKLIKFIPLFALLVACAAIAPTRAQAQCANPTATAGAIIFNSANSTMQTCNGTTWRAWPKRNMDGWKKISAGVLHSCGIKMDNSLWCWGHNQYGQIGDGTTTTRLTPVPVSGGGQWLDVTARGGMYHSPPNYWASTCGIKLDGSLHCWGNNEFNGLGRAGGSAGNASVPTPVSFGGTWKRIHGGYNMACGIRSDDRLFCWGDDVFRQLGDGATLSTGYTAREVSGGGTWKMMDVDPWYNRHACGIKSDDTLWCWGQGASGRLGNGSNANQGVPTAVTTTGVTTWKSVSTGYDATCGIKTDDTLWCWGSNNQGQLARGFFSAYEPLPAQINTTNGATWKSLSLGDGSSCGIRTDDTLWCWGYGMEGNHGNGIISSQTVPVPVSGNRLWKQVSADWSVCGIQFDDTLWCWAENYFGSVGNNTDVQQDFPVPIAAGTCQNPAGVAGDILFNEDYLVLQWCDGFKWYAAGKSPTFPMGMGCTGPVGAAGDLIYNSTLNLTQYCDGDRWRSIHR